jgi:hypothetical protein
MEPELAAGAELVFELDCDEPEGSAPLCVPVDPSTPLRLAARNGSGCAFSRRAFRRLGGLRCPDSASAMPVNE